MQRQADDAAIRAARESAVVVDIARFAVAVFSHRTLVVVVVEVGDLDASFDAEEFGAVGGDPDYADAVGGCGFGRLC